MKILLTGFEPFNNSPINPSEELIKAFTGQNYQTAVVKTCLLPVDAHLAPETLIASIQKFSPDIVICLGQAGGRKVISVERIAINLLDFRIPDNQGIRLNATKIIDNGADGYFSTLPVEKLQTVLIENNVPCEISYSAGTFLCNQVFYVLMHQIRQNHLPVIGGFIHFPYLPEQVSPAEENLPTLSLETDLKALKIIFDILIEDDKNPHSAPDSGKSLEYPVR